MQCEICKSFTTLSPIGLASHLATHKISTKDYYDTFLKKPGEGFCCICSNPTKFRTLGIGYARWCCKRCIQSDDNVRKKQNSTKLIKYGEETYNNRNKAKETCIKKFGCENPNKSDIVKTKKKETCMIKYGGIAPACNLAVQEKMKITCREKFNSDYFITSEKGQQVRSQEMLRKYGTIHALQNNDVMNNMKQRNVEKFGYEWPCQQPGFQKRITKQYQYDGRTFASKLEIAVYKRLSDMKVDFIYQPDIALPYIYDNHLHYYHPDFKVGNRLLEVKGLHFFKDKDINSTMINPYDRSSDGIFEAKHQCMIENKVIIITNAKVITQEELGLTLK